VIFSQSTAIRWLIASAQQARARGWNAEDWWHRIDLQMASVAMAYVTPRQVQAIQALVWSRRPML